MTVFSRNHLQRISEIYYGTRVKPTSIRGILCNFPNPAAITDQTSLATILAGELPEINGYARTVIPTTIDSSAYNTTVNAWRLTWARSFSATGASLTYNAIATLWNAPATANKIVTALDTGTDRLTVAGHGLAGDPVTLTVDTGGTYPANGQSVGNETLLYAKSIDANTVELYTNVGLTTIVNFTSAGTGTLRLRYAAGDWDIVDVPLTPTPIAAGTSLPFNFNIDTRF